MEVPISEDEGVLTEWAPYTNLINQIPLKILSGLFTQDLSLTCIDVTNEYLALGTNTGLVFWYCRQRGDLQRLRCEVSNSPITFVKIVSTVDFMVAAGNKIGQVTVFEIPKTHPESLPESLKPKVARRVERYTVGDLHQAEITFIEWSKNGMRLFSGDKNGLVVMTEIDFYMHLCKSSEIINESYEIVQISYYQNHLLVSSVYRSIICQKRDSKWDVNQVGKRDRKSLCSLGGVFQYDYERPGEVNIYCARPGLRIWTSDRQGNVLQTLLFKDAISSPCSQVELLNPSLKRSVKSTKETHFGPLFVFKDRYLVSHNDAQLYILNPDSLVAVATVDNVRSILSVAVNKEEIFILEGDRSLIRIAYSPESQVDQAEENLMTKSLTNPIQLAVNTIKELTSLQTQMNLSGLLEHCELNSDSSTALASLSDSPSIAPAEECFELPLVQELPNDINTNMLDKIMHNLMGDKDGVFDNDDPTYTDPDMDRVISGMKHFEEVIDKKNQMYNLINGKGFEEDILYKSKKSRRNNIINLDSSSTDLKEPPEAGAGALQVNGDCSVRAVAGRKNPIPRNPKPFSGMPSSAKSPPAGSMSPESIEKEIKAKEEILARVLDLEPVTVSTLKLPSPETLYMHSDILTPDASTLIKSLYVKLPSEEARNTKHVIKTQEIKAPASKETPGPRQTGSPPKCITIPNMWNLKEIKIDAWGSPPRGVLRPGVKVTHRKVSENEDLDDWELV